MKKARIILLCMLVLGTVGGIVAFKANAFEARRVTPICYSLPVNGNCISPYRCTSMTTIKTTLVGTLLCTTSYDPLVGCTNTSKICNVLATVTGE
jgi:hypothetical protein